MTSYKNLSASLTILLASFIVLSTIPLAFSQKSCKALVLEGGGDKGAYEAGVLYGWVKNTQDPEEFQYDVITGISIGAINAMGIGQFPKGSENEAVDYLLSTWKNTNQRDVFVSWPGGLIEGLFFKRSLFNNDPEINYLQSLITVPPTQRRITVAATDFFTGEKVTFNEKDWGDNIELAINASLYSSAVPVVFLYRESGDKMYVDGGWSGEALDIEDAVFRCREIVDSDEEITIDIIFAGNVTHTDVDAAKFNTFQIYTRHMGIQSFSTSTRAYSYARDSFPDVNFRYVMVASEKLPNQDLPLDFKPKNIDFMINLGMKDALTSLAEGPGISAQRVYEMSVKYQDDLFNNAGQY